MSSVFFSFGSRISLFTSSSLLSTKKTVSLSLTHLEEVDALRSVNVKREQVLPVARAVSLEQSRERRRRRLFVAAGPLRRRLGAVRVRLVAGGRRDAVCREQARGEVQPGLLLLRKNDRERKRIVGRKEEGGKKGGERRKKGEKRGKRGETEKRGDRKEREKERERQEKQKTMMMMIKFPFFC